VEFGLDGVRKGRQPFLEHVNPDTYTYTRCERLLPHAEQVPSFVYVYEHDSAPGTFLDGLGLVSDQAFPEYRSSPELPFVLVQVWRPVVLG